NSRLILTRWAAGFLVLLGTYLCTTLLGLPLPAEQLYWVGIAILLYNAVLALIIRRARARQLPVPTQYQQRLIGLQVGLDWLALTVFLQLTGGATSPAIPLLAIHMLLVTILLPSPAQILYLALGIGALMMIVILEYRGILPHHNVIPGIPPDLYLDPVYVSAQVGLFTVAAASTVALASDVMSRLRRRERQVTALLQTSEALSATLSLSDVLERLARNAALALQAPSASIRLLEEGSDNLPMVASYGLSRAYQEKGPVYLSKSAHDREALAGHVVIVANALADRRIQYPAALEAERLRSLIVAPIIGRRGPMGVLRAYRREVGAFDEQSAEFALAIARQGGAAIENAMSYQALQEEDAARAQFVRTVTHELRSPTSGAQSLLRALLHQHSAQLTEQQRDILQRVDARLDVLTDLINDLLALAKSKTAGFQAEPEPTDLTSLLQQITGLYRSEAAAKSIRLEYHSPANPVRVLATEEGIGLIFGNLLSNAVKYTPPGGEIRVGLVTEKDTAQVRVADTGIGIPQGEQGRLWEEFWRATNARRSQSSGTGLGLSIVKRLVEGFGGMITVQSTEGEGTTFTVALPSTKR
ncbi:MAG: ATP-binding protein, partial [Anaerolineales bacterium]|nr:ATP-binding protein [Anaerolineales bacterium]